ncbi:hypothetical protein [Nonomuraea wenchangensis]|uniref:Uncharacterized protein n=1 Tax=Nonomuraea wenchangensis TaxID=568860 RepID=A0A1I0LF36_9ACTN|nr:hypothetical protein [Nonomuraea wenchangensis]SEU38695.1 hypothetical protein SAMN05421811_1166 [Nonomuraea wenchangensis]
MTYVDKTYSELAAIRGGLPLLSEAMIPGTPRRWVERDLSESEIARQGAEHKADRIERVTNLAKGLKPTGNSRAPLNLAVLDTQMSIEEVVKELEEAVCERLGLSVLASTSSADRITRLISLLDRIALDEDLAEHVLAESRRMGRQVRQALGDAEVVHKIRARCPICGSKSIRAFTERELIACINPGCRCDDDDCVCQQDLRHLWAYSQWPALAEVFDAQRSAA